MDPRKIKPSQLCRLLNSTPQGEVISDRLLRLHRTRAGFRIGDEKTVDLFRYAAWLARNRHANQEPKPGDTGYAAYRERKAREAREQSLSGRDIGATPAVVNPERRAKAERDFRFFCEQYFPQTFAMAWSDDHLKVIAKIERVVLEGGLFAIGMPRGSGKTSLCEAGGIWAMLYGHRNFIVLIGSDEPSAGEMLDSIKSEIENNDLMLNDFPEVCFPVRALEGITQRSAGQLCLGKPTHIGWSAREIVLPTIDGSKASGAIVRVAGITGRIRGMKFKRPDGESARPDVVLIDDPQTDESARSPSQCATRERTIAGAILGLAGPGKKIAGLAPVTVIQEGDMADRLLDREKHPQWQGERTKLVYAFPANEDIWDQYRGIRDLCLREERGLEEANEFYLANREAMDEGCKVAWPQRFEAGEHSAIQHAMNLRFDRGDAAFFAEYQNEPLPDVPPDADVMTAEAIAAKTNGAKRREIPAEASHLTAFIDVQGKMLYWMVCAWQDNFTGFIVDYGTEPDQKSPYFTLRDARRSLKMATPNAGQEGAIYAGLDRVCEHLLDREWVRRDGAAMRIDRALVDANWGESTDVVYKFCRQSKWSGVLLPSHGRGVGPSAVPFSDYTRKRGERVGLNWRMPLTAGKRAVRHVIYDTNFWKSFVHARLAVAMGDPGCLSLFGDKHERHRMVAEHIAAEYRVKTEGRGRTVDVWKLRADGLDNHFLDTLVGNAVAANMEGVELAGLGEVRERRRRKVSFSEMQRAKRSAAR